MLATCFLAPRVPRLCSSLQRETKLCPPGLLNANSRAGHRSEKVAELAAELLSGVPLEAQGVLSSPLHRPGSPRARLMGSHPVSVGRPPALMWQLVGLAGRFSGLAPFLCGSSSLVAQRPALWGHREQSRPLILVLNPSGLNLPRPRGKGLPEEQLPCPKAAPLAQWPDVARLKFLETRATRVGFACLVPRGAPDLCPPSPQVGCGAPVPSLRNEGCRVE